MLVCSFHPSQISAGSVFTERYKIPPLLYSSSTGTARLVDNSVRSDDRVACLSCTRYDSALATGTTG